MVATKDLIKAGFIAAGEVLIWNRRSHAESHIATVKGDGTIETSDGKIHRTPSGAAKHLNGNKPVDGWLAWKLKSTGESLAVIREKISS